MEIFTFLISILIEIFIFVSFSRAEIVPSFPLQFSGKLTITAHLIDPANEYPPRNRVMHIYYDYLNKKARADIEPGYEAAKTYIRLYSTMNEYMIRLPPINDCKRSYLSELMPFPDIPDSKYVKDEVINGIKCHYFLYEEYEGRIHIYMNAENGAPIRLIQESIVDEISTPLLTYDFSDISLDQPDDNLFLIPYPFEHSTCQRHVGGFPYLHIFHHFVMF